MKIDFNNFLFIKKIEDFIEDWKLNLRISFLKYQPKAKTLPSWMIADKELPGSSRPKKRDITFKWAVLLLNEQYYLLVWIL